MSAVGEETYRHSPISAEAPDHKMWCAASVAPVRRPDALRASALWRSHAIFPQRGDAHAGA